MKNNNVDIDLIQRLKDGDETAFETIYNDFYQYIYYMALQYFNNDEFAKDIVQETFFRVFKSIHTLNSPEAFNVWIKRIAFSICHAKYKSKKKDFMFYAEEEDNLLDIIYENNRASSPVDEARFNDVKKIILDALERMKPEIRVIGYLRFFEELSFEEIADVADVSVGTVGSRIARIKKKLQVVLKENGYSTTTCCSIVATPFLFEIYKSWSQSIDLSIVSKSGVYEHDTSVNSISARLMLSNIHNFYPYIATVCILLASVACMQLVKQSVDGRQIAENQIIAIHYDESYTNKPLKLEIETQNQDYDTIQIDGHTTNYIKTNGKHIISIEKDGIKLDQKEITITNIDTDAPFMIDSKFVDDVIIITVSDKGSGVDYKISSLKNDSNHNLVIDEEKGKFILDKDIEKDTSLKLYDRAGNLTVINVTKLEVFRQIN